MTLCCFKAYDIRGRVPDEFDTTLAERIGRAYADVIRPGCVVIGRDVRDESPALAEAVCRGLVAGGTDVIDIGLCGTEEVYFHTFDREAEGVGGGIMITASHNPKGYNGLKLVREGARPLSNDTGLLEIKARVEAMGHVEWTVPPTESANVSIQTDKRAYIEHLLGYVDRSRLPRLKIVANPGNGGAGAVIEALKPHLPFDFVVIQGEPDGSFPNGVPNPLLPENRRVTAEAVIEHGANLGLAWDGDFDRCFFFDETGRFIEGYYLVGLLAELFLTKSPDETIIHDPRLTWNTLDLVATAGGRAVQSKTGHAFIKQRMREEKAVYGGEMSAHHYFRDFAFCDSGMIPWLLITELLGRRGEPFSRMVEERMAAFPCSGEINYRVAEGGAVLARIEEYFSPKTMHIDRTDGLGMVFDDWRFNVRTSNTEPLLRLNVESRADPAAVERHVAGIESLIQSNPS